MDHRSLRSRVLTAMVGIPLLLGAAWLGGWWWGAIVLVIAGIAGAEYWRLLHPADLGGAIALAVGIGLSWFLIFPWVVLVGTLVLFAFGILPPVLSGNPSRAGWLAWRWGAVLLGWAYLGTATAVIASWGFLMEFWTILWLFVVIWINDIVAYFAGYTLGRHKLAPEVSPGKSWEGAAAGLVAGTASGLVFGSWLSVPPLAGALLGAAVTIASQLGDLFESAIKRRAGAKDSGVIVPGHGGVLDRFDGVFAAAPVAYLLLQWFAS